MEVAASSDVEALGGGVRRDDEVGAGGESVPVVVLLVSRTKGLLFVLRDLPADPVRLHLPVCSILAIEDVVRVCDVLLQLASHLPLGVITLRRRC